MAPLAGLRLRPTNFRAAFLAALACIALVTGYILLLDGVLFRGHLPPAYVSFFGGPDLPLRIVAMAVKAVGEEVAFRLILMTGIVSIGGLIWRKDWKTHPAVFVVAILLVQMADVLPQTPTPATATAFTYDVLRFYLPGLVWGWLYWRHGFLAGLIAHPLTHVVLQPLLLVALKATW